jgi:hypothetical protein
MGPFAADGLPITFPHGRGFLYNIPAGLATALLTWNLLKSSPRNAHAKLPIDKVGLGLLVIWLARCKYCWIKGKSLIGSTYPDCGAGYREP